MEKTRSKAGEMIREGRLAKGWSQRQVGKMLGYGYGNFVTMVENGDSLIPLDKIPILCELLDLDTKALLKEVMICRHPGLAKYL